MNVIGSDVILWGRFLVWTSYIKCEEVSFQTLPKHWIMYTYFFSDSYFMLALYLCAISEWLFYGGRSVEHCRCIVLLFFVLSFPLFSIL